MSREQNGGSPAPNVDRNLGPPLCGNHTVTGVRAGGAVRLASPPHLLEADLRFQPVLLWRARPPVRVPLLGEAAEGHRDGAHYLRSLRERGREDVMAALLALDGVGPKVADCVALFSLDQRAAIPVDKRIRQGRLLAAIGAHDPQERNDLFDTFVKAPLLTPPLKMNLDKYKNYFGEKQGLAMVFLAHLTNAYFIIGAIGLAIQLTLVGLDNRAAWPIVIYGFAVILWSVFVTEFWKRDEKRIAMLWGIVRCMNQPVISR